MTTLSPTLTGRIALTIVLLASCLITKSPSSLASATKAPSKSCVLNGPSCVAPGQAGIYTLTGGTVAGWTVGCATIAHSTSTLVEAIMPWSGCSSTSIETAGATCGGAAVNVVISTSCAASFPVIY